MKGFFFSVGFVSGSEKYYTTSFCYLVVVDRLDKIELLSSIFWTTSGTGFFTPLCFYYCFFCRFTIFYKFMLSTRGSSSGYRFWTSLQRPPYSSSTFTFFTFFICEQIRFNADILRRFYCCFTLTFSSLFGASSNIAIGETTSFL